MTSETPAAAPVPSTTDVVLRAMTDDGAFRVMVARTTDTVRAALERQNPSNRARRYFGDLLTASVLFRETMSPGLRVQAILRGTHRGTLVADSKRDGLTRGLVQEKVDFELGEGSLLQMMRTLHNGSVQQGVVRVPMGHGEGSISEAMMVYMKDSEQVDTMLALSTTFADDGSLQAAGGYLVQLLPEVGKAPLAIMAERLEDFRSIDHLVKNDFSPHRLRDELLYGMPFTALDETSVEWNCWCSEERLIAALATLDRSEIQSMVDDGEPLEIICDYCRTEYNIAPVKLRGLLDPS